MIGNVITIAAMGLMGIAMVNKSVLVSTRRMALLPLSVCVVEMVTFGLLSAALFPVLSFLLWAMRLCILACCGLKLRQDISVARRRARRRALTEKYQQASMRGCVYAVSAQSCCA